jgi:hypothetical protein
MKSWLSWYLGVTQGRVQEEEQRTKENAESSVASFRPVKAGRLLAWHGMSDEAERAQEAHERQRLEVEDHISAAIRRRGAWVMGPRSSLSSW